MGIKVLLGIAVFIIIPIIMNIFHIIFIILGAPDILRDHEGYPRGHPVGVHEDSSEKFPQSLISEFA